MSATSPTRTGSRRSGAAGARRPAARPAAALALGAAALAAAAAIAVFTGPVSVGLGDVVRAISGAEPLSRRDAAVLLDIRLPRVALAALAGAALATAGAAYQAVFRNPLADPYLLGVSSGAGLAVTVAVAAGVTFGAAGGAGIIGAAFAGGVLAVATTWCVGAGAGRGSSATAIVLAGVAVAAFANAAQTWVQQRNIDTLQSVYSWMLGSLSGARWSTVAAAAIPAVACAAALVAAARVLDVMTVGDLEARSLGVDPALARAAIVALATLATASVVAVSGLIGFIGIIVPHAVRLAAGPGHRLLLPLTALWGAAFLIAADAVARMVVSPGELPVGVVTAFCGAPFFLWLLRRGRRAAA
ncbi:FecCD family ABC transporter permease [Corynebacterium sp. 335C]